MPGMIGQVRPDYEYWHMDIYRPWSEVLSLVDKWKPTTMVTEVIEGITEPIVSLGLPTVVAPGEYDADNVVSIDVNDVQVGHLAAQHLLDLGIPNLAYLGNQTIYSVQRHRGFGDSISVNGIPLSAHIEKEPRAKQYLEHFQPPSKALIRWLRRLPKPVGIFAAHDPLGRLLSETCRDLQLSIPEEVSLLAANNDELICDLTTPPLSSIDIPWKRIGSEVIHWANRIGTEGLPTQRHFTIDPLPVHKRQSTEVSAVESPRLAQILQYIDREATRGINVNDVLHAFPVSRRWLEKTCLTYLGKSPKSHILDKRLEAAKRLLIHTDLMISEVAERSGFSSGERFAVNFRRKETITPSQFRKEYSLSPQG